MVEPDATDDYNTVHAHCMMDNCGYRHNTLGICNAYCFSLATTLTETRLISTFIRTLPAYYYIVLLTVTCRISFSHEGVCEHYCLVQ
jgi:hypothetical protein